MTYEQYKKRVAAISRWFDGYIIETFHSVHQFGHLEKYHINKDNTFLMERSKRLKRDISNFVGEEREIVAMLISCILDNRQELIEYIADVDDCDVWEITGQLKAPVSGKSYHYNISHNWEDGALPCTHFKISFKKNEHSKNAIVITSAYPY